MTADEEAKLRARIVDLQHAAARAARKGSNTGRGYDPRPYFDSADEYLASAEILQRLLEAAGLQREPKRDRWDFGLD